MPFPPPTHTSVGVGCDYPPPAPARSPMLGGGSYGPHWGGTAASLPGRPPAAPAGTPPATGAFNASVLAGERREPEDDQGTPSTSTTTACPVRTDDEVALDTGGRGCRTLDTAVDLGYGNMFAQGNAPRSHPDGDPEITWVYNVRNPLSSALGHGWWMGPLKQVDVGDQGATVITAGGVSRYYTGTGPGTYTKPTGVTTSLTHNANGTWTEKTVWGRQWDYESVGRLTKHTDRRGNVFTYSYDGSNRMTTITGPYSQVHTFAYDGNSKLSSITDPAGRITTFTVDGNGDLTSVTTPNLCVTSYSYDASHRLTGIVSPEGYVRTFAYDSGSSQLTSVINAAGRRTTNSYDSPPAQPGTVSVADPLGSNWTATYNRWGNMLTSVTPLGHRTTRTYDDGLRLVSIQPPAGGRTTYSYTSAGRLSWMANGLAKRTTFTYDANNFATG